MDRKITFIGGGNMAEVIIRSMIQDSQFSAKKIYVYEILDSRMDFLVKKYGINPCEDMKLAIENADIIIFSVRPQDAKNVSLQIKPYLSRSSIFVSICAGVTINSFSTWFNQEQKIVRVMPNTLTETQHGFSAICPNDNILKHEIEIVVKIFRTIGQITVIPENMFDRFTAYSCAGPAYLLFMINAMIDAGVRAGFSRQESREMIIENIIGTGLKMKQTGNHPFEIMDTMTSPGGVSIEGLYSMNKEGIYGSIMNSIEKAIQRAEEIKEH